MASRLSNYVDWLIGTTKASLRNIIGTSETKEWPETKAIVQEFTESNTVGKHLEEYPVNQKWFIDHASKKGWQRVIVHFKRCWKTYFPNESIKLQVWYNIMYPSPKPTWMRKPTKIADGFPTNSGDFPHDFVSLPYCFDYNTLKNHWCSRMNTLVFHTKSS